MRGRHFAQLLLDCDLVGQSDEHRTRLTEVSEYVVLMLCAHEGLLALHSNQLCALLVHVHVCVGAVARCARSACKQINWRPAVIRTVH
jgi:hypothetical protein